MKAVIVTIGDELLIGETVDTNGAWMAKAVDDAGMEVGQILTISDRKSDILSKVKESLNNYDLVLITGGLGPTHDDVTKQVLTEMFSDKLVFNSEVYDDVQTLLKRFGRSVSELNRSQAMIPSKCTVIRNDRGTAPGMVFKQGVKHLISMPGVPHEMRSMMRRMVIPLILDLNEGKVRIHRHIKTFGVPEADLAEILKEEINSLNTNVKMAFLPAPGHVKIRLTVKGKSKKEANTLLAEEERKLLLKLDDVCYGFDSDVLESVIGKQLSELKKTVSTAESCTGGFLASKISSIPGSSEYFVGSVIAYSNQVKSELLKVSAEDIKKQGAVSETVVCQMAKGVRERMRTDYGLATSGIAGPDGGSQEKPVGTIWIALSDSDGERAVKLKLGFNRTLNISLTADHVLNLLRKELKKMFD